MKYRESKEMNFRISLNLSLEAQKLALCPTLLNLASVKKPFQGSSILCMPSII